MKNSSFNQFLNNKVKKNSVSRNFNNRDLKKFFFSNISLLKNKSTNYIKVNLNNKDYPKPHTKHSSPNIKTPPHIKLNNSEIFLKKQEQTKLNSYLSFKHILRNNDNDNLSNYNNNSSVASNRHSITKSSLSDDGENNKYMYLYNKKYLCTNNIKTFNFFINCTNKTIYNKVNKIKNLNVTEVYKKRIPEKTKKENLFNLIQKNNNDNFLLYLIDENNTMSDNFSTSKDYNYIIKKYINDKKSLILLLNLPKRNWYLEINKLVDSLIQKTIVKHYFINNEYFIRKLIKIHEHFKFLANSLGYFFNNFFYNNNIKLEDVNRNLFLPTDIQKWFNGFEWKGIYIKILPNEKSSYIKNEIKALNYFFFDYLNIIENNDKNEMLLNTKSQNKNLLSNYLIFPLISYTEINGFVLFTSVLINNNDINMNDNENISIKEIISHNNGFINTNYAGKIKVNVNRNIKDNIPVKTFLSHFEKKYYIKDLQNSIFFGGMDIYHFIRIFTNKFLIFNLNEFLPKLFGIKNTSLININFISTINNKKINYTLRYNQKNKNQIKSNNISTPRDVLKNIFKINTPLNNFKTKDIIINDLIFRVLYLNLEPLETGNQKKFVDYLFNYSNNFNIKNNNNFKENYIKEPFVIIYDLFEPIKLKYSLIMNNKIKNKKDFSINNYYSNSNYYKYFINWCKMIDKNNFSIKNYYSLKEIMKKYGIFSFLKFSILLNINNKEIVDIIKIYFLVKVIKFAFGEKSNENFLLKLNEITCNNNLNKLLNYSLSDLHKKGILFLINSILYPNEVKNQNNKYFKSFTFLYEQLIFYTNIIFIKTKVIEDYLSFNNLHKTELKVFNSPKNFLINIISTARKKPFLFLSEMEYKLNFLIDPYIKFKASISLESMNKQLKLEHIFLNTNKTFSYINSNEISGFILSKIINFFTSNLPRNSNYSNIDSDYNNIFKKNFNNKSIKNKELFTISNNFETFEKSNNINLIKNWKKYTPKNDGNLRKTFKLCKNDSNCDELSNNIYLNTVFSNDNKNSLQKYYKVITEFNSSTPRKMQQFNISSNNNKIININQDILNNFQIQLSPICYKMKYISDDSELTIPSSKISEISSHAKSNLDFIYLINDENVIKEWNKTTKYIFSEILSCDGKVENTLFKSLIYEYLVNFFQNNITESQKINSKIKNIYSRGGYQLSLNDLSIINLLEALCLDKYIESEEPYSKSLMVLLMNYGDPRGRNCNSHRALLFPIWKIARKAYKLKDYLIDVNFQEMFQCLDYYENQNRNNNDNKNENKFSYGPELNNVDKNSVNTNNTNNNNDFLCLNCDDIFNDNLIHKIAISNFKFPDINDDSNSIDKVFLEKDFVLYFFKMIQCLLYDNNKTYSEEYINKYISKEFFNPYPHLNNKYKIENISQKQNLTEQNILDSSLLYEDYGKKSIKHYETSSNFNTNRTKNSNSTNKKIKKLGIGLNANTFYFHKKNKNYSKVLSPLNLSTNRTPMHINLKKKIGEKSEKKFLHLSNSYLCISSKRKLNNILSHYLYDELMTKLSYRANLPSGIILSFGNNTHNETSHDKEKIISIPRVIYKLKNKIIEHIYSGWEHNIIILNNGDIYSFGHNQFYQCGIKENKKKQTKIINNPTNISILNNNIKGISASCGNEHTLILSTENDVYAFGNNEDGALGIENNKIKKYEFTKINFNNNKIKSISAGTIHNLALTINGKIFSWGSSLGGQLGLSENYLLSQPQFKQKNFLSTPTIIKFPENQIIIKKISCGEAHSIALTNNGEVFTWGFGSNGQLGQGFCEDSFEPGSGLIKSRKFTPKKINIKNIIDIQCGKTFSMIINKNNELFGFGVNDLNQLGINDMPSKKHLFNKDFFCCDFIFPTKVECFIKMKVKKIACGEGHCLAVINETYSNIENIWSWGNNKFGQLGQGNIVKKSLPNPIKYLLGYNNFNFSEISCGGFHSLCLIKHKESIDWIEKDFQNIVDEINKIEIL